MTDRFDEESGNSCRRRIDWLRWGRHCALGALVVIAFFSAALGGWHLSRFPSPVLIASLILTLLAWAVILLVSRWRHERRWNRPLANLRRTVKQVRAGEAAIEELSAIEGPLMPVATSIQELLRENRRQKVELLHLEREMSQRVAQRTDALERTIASLRHQASRDPLTGLYNRRMLDQHLPALVERARGGGGPLCVVMFDLDRFKALNDTLGHAAGDEFLRTVGQLVRSSMRSDDLAFRYGGDEFVVVLPTGGAESAERLARRLKHLVDGVSRTHPLVERVSISCGIATTEMASCVDAGALLSAADINLYAVKARRKPASPKAPLPA